MKFVILVVGTVVSTVLSNATAQVVQQTADETSEVVANVAADPNGQSTVYQDNVGGFLNSGRNCGCPPTWYVEADPLYLNRTRSHRIKLVEDQNQSHPDPPRGHRTALLTTDDLDFDYEWGPRLTFGRYLDDCRRVEFTYYGLHHWRSTASLDSTAEPEAPPNLSMPFYSNYTSDLDGAEHVDVSYTSELHNVEANYLVDQGWCVTPLVGFRYINLNEKFGYWATSLYHGEPETGSYRINTDNSLVGCQVGAVLDRSVSDRLSWNFGIKTGLYVDFAHQHTWLHDHDDHEMVSLRNYSRDQGELAFVGELGLGVVYQLSQCMAVSAGYQLTWLDGVALAPEQLDYNTGLTSGSGLNTNGDVFYDGGYVGLVITR